MKKYKSPYKVYWSTSVIIFLISTIFLLWWYARLDIRIKFFNAWFWLLYFLAINCTVGSLYLYDKMIAGNTKTARVPEIILQTLALLGGSPVALLSQKLFHHKTNKKSFQIMYWLIVFVQVGLFIFIFQERLFG